MPKKAKIYLIGALSTLFILCCLMYFIFSTNLLDI